MARLRWRSKRDCEEREKDGKRRRRTGRTGAAQGRERGAETEAQQPGFVKSERKGRSVRLRARPLPCHAVSRTMAEAACDGRGNQGVYRRESLPAEGEG